MDILLTSGLPWPTILYTILIDEVMIITGLVGALVTSSYKVNTLRKNQLATLLTMNSGDTSSSDASLFSGWLGPSFGQAESTPLPLALMFRKLTSLSVLGLLSSGSSTQLPGDFPRAEISSHLTLKLSSTVFWISWPNQSLALS